MEGQLFQALLALTGRELHELEQYVQSPYLNGNAAATRLYDYLKGCIRLGESPDKQGAFSAAFPGRPYNDQRLRLTASALLALTQGFLAHKEYSSQPERNRLRTVSAYRRRGLGRHFASALREAQKAVEKQPFRHAEYWDDRYAAAWEQYQMDTSGRRTGFLNLQELSEHLDVAFAIRKLRLACLALAHQALEKVEYSIDHVTLALACADKNAHRVPVLELYACCYRFLAEKEAAAVYFNRARHLLLEHASLLPADELRPLYLLAINFGIRLINTGEADWPRATLELYQQALARELLLENGFLSRFAFNNIVAIALRLYELDWAENFVQQYRPFLEREWREVTASLNSARIAFARGNHAAALVHLQRADYRDPLNNLIAKTLQLKIYYESGEYEALESHLSSMQTFIRRHTRIGYHRTNYLKTVHFVRKILRLKKADHRAAADLRSEIEGEAVLTEKAWLLEKLGEYGQ